MKAYMKIRVFMSDHQCIYGSDESAQAPGEFLLDHLEPGLLIVKT